MPLGVQHGILVDTSSRIVPVHCLKHPIAGSRRETISVQSYDRFDEIASARRRVPYAPRGPIDPIAAQVAQAFAAVPLSAYPVAMTRDAMRAACSPTREPALHAVDDHAVEVDGGTILARAYRPSASSRAIVVWAHGGGFALGSVEEIDNFARVLARRTNCTVVSVDYRLAPEYQFPVAIDDLASATTWVLAHRVILAGDEVPVWLGGDSAGGNLATVVTRRLHDEAGPAIAGNLLIYPCTDSPDDPALRDFQPPFMTVEDVTWFIDGYLPDTELRTHPDFAPVRAAGLERLPPTLVVTAEHDILTPQAEAYADRLEQMGVAVGVARVPGMIHGFLTLDAFLPGAATVTIDVLRAFIDRH
jgi:acetyl esterase